MGFSAFKFDPRIAAGIRALGYAAPTPIQLRSIAPILQGRDVLGLAQTGTGNLEDAFLALTGESIREEEVGAIDNLRMHARMHGGNKRR